MTSGYACPVCDTPQRDAEHLANHVAFTAMLRAEEHETWLDEHVPGWSNAGPDELADRVVEYADEAEYREVFEDTVARGATNDRGDHGDTGHDHDDPGRPSIDAADTAGHGYDGGAGRPAGDGASDETAAVLEEARELTRRMHEADESGAEGDGVDVDGADDAESESESESDPGPDQGGQE